MFPPRPGMPPQGGPPQDAFGPPANKLEPMVSHFMKQGKFPTGSTLEVRPPMGAAPPRPPMAGGPPGAPPMGAGGSPPGGAPGPNPMVAMIMQRLAQAKAGQQAGGPPPGGHGHMAGGPPCPTCGK